nr:hypothetical protein A4A49_09742 [Ipomoea batatas]GMC96717.1 hypothetical protein A4A49_09742 [Ipomoea batatas]GME09952.1 hypothetical protein A4A49_09742 [Ipomoea batatas]
MADIAILVAEEYERRIKNARKLGSMFKGQKLEGSSSSLVKVKLSGGEEKRLEMMMKNKVLQPHFEVGVAARNGFFSA